MKRVASFTNEECDAYFINHLDVEKKRRILSVLITEANPYRDIATLRDIVSIVGNYLHLADFYRLSACCKHFRRLLTTYGYAKRVQLKPTIREMGNFLNFRKDDNLFMLYTIRFMRIINDFEVTTDVCRYRIKKSRVSVKINDVLRVNKPSGFIFLKNAPTIMRGHVFEDGLERYRNICNFSELIGAEKLRIRELNKTLLL